MSTPIQCMTCLFERESGTVIDDSRTNVEWAEAVGVGEASIRRHKAHAGRVSQPVDQPPGETTEITTNNDGTKQFNFIRHRPVTLEDARELIRSSGDDPDRYNISIRTISYGQGQSSNKISAWPKTGMELGPAWPVIQPATTKTPKIGKWKTAILGADTQIGYRLLEDGSTIPFHDEAAIDVFLQVTEAENPDLVSLLGDIIDLPSQSRWAQEASFANTTQRAIDRTSLLAAQLRNSAPHSEIVFIEGNHDKRMQGFIETNALAAFGLRKANLPESWPVMSLPNLLRLDEYGVTYKDAYPAAHYWVNDKLRLEHGTKANSKGSTASQYMNETPHISRAHGHTHRLEVQSKTTYDRMGKIRNMAINPGCLCRVDGAVPSVNGAIGADGKPATVYEDWQQGLIVIRYREGDEFFVDGVVQIDDGKTVYQGQDFQAA